MEEDSRDGAPGPQPPPRFSAHSEGSLEVMRPTPALIGVLLALGCTTSLPPVQPEPTAKEVRGQNRARLVRLALGMPRPEVLEVMGTDTIRTQGRLLIPNPYRTEATRLPDGSAVELLLYYTDHRRADGRITRDELTPLLLERGRLVGWGWLHLRWNEERRSPERPRLQWRRCELYRRCPEAEVPFF